MPLGLSINKFKTKTRNCILGDVIALKQVVKKIIVNALEKVQVVLDYADAKIARIST